MAIANVSQTCGRAQGRLLAVTFPVISTSPFQHSGACGHRAPTSGTAAGHPLMTVGIPKTPGTDPAAGGREEDPSGASAALPAGERTRAPMIAAAAMITIMPAISATGRATRVRRVGAAA